MRNLFIEHQKFMNVPKVLECIMQKNPKHNPMIETW